MAEEPDRLRREIEGTRASLTRDVDMLAEKTSPKRVAQRRWTDVKEKVMGTSQQTRHAASSTVGTVQDKAAQAGAVAGEKAQEAAEAVRSVPDTVTRQTQGNPLAAGIIAFGAGMLAATLIPVTEAERQAGRQIRDNSEELTGQVKKVAGDMGSDLKENLQEAVGQVKETAQDAARTTKEQAQSSAQDATQQTKQAAQNA